MRSHLSLLVLVFFAQGMAFCAGLFVPALRYPVGYNPDARGRPHVTEHPRAVPRWEPPVGYDPRRRGGDAPAPPDTMCCPMPNCPLDASAHLCTGVWMGRVILDRRCLRIK